MFKPRNSYRIQFQKNFTLNDLERILPYLQRLGIDTIYASPIFEAVPGSVHGYDVVNPLRINPEIGTEEQLLSISGRLRAMEMGWIQDIVPNHMAFHSNNFWLMDVLEKGRASVYASFFDMPWTSDLFHGKLIAPVLGSGIDDVLEKHEVQLAYEDTRFVLRYYENVLPVNSRSYTTILQQQDRSQAIAQIISQIDDLHQLQDPIAYNLRWHEITLQLRSMSVTDEMQNYISTCVSKFNTDRELLRSIIEEQHYRLTDWRITDSEINFRRFFTINNLIGVNMQHEKVFSTYHKLIKNLIDKNVFQGLRIDHVDGLYDPSLYLKQLRDLAGPDMYIVIEKILQVDEKLPEAWSIQGTTGYDFLALANNVFSSRKTKTLSALYEDMTEDEVSIGDQLLEKKSFILRNHMQGELDNLYNMMIGFELIDRDIAVDPDMLKEALASFLIYCPVYRYYGNAMPLAEEERMAVHTIFQKIKTRRPELGPSAELIESIFLIKPQLNDNSFNERAAIFYMRCMQFTGPLMAKGVEDTLMYTYNRFIGQNEVGDSPLWFGLSRERFHEKIRQRQQAWPLSLNATATHDTKRGEDSRMWLAVLSEVPKRWSSVVEKLREMNYSLKSNDVPDPNDEYLLYQVLIGAGFSWNEPGFSERLAEYLTKALREAKRNSNWTGPNEKYEAATISFANTIQQSKRFKLQLKRFDDGIEDFAVVNSLSQVILKYTCPGVPDLYQGCELWDFSFVDPDNRRAVDYDLRMASLNDIEMKCTENRSAFIRELWEQRVDGKIKQWVSYELMKLRNTFPDVFSDGHYVPLGVRGTYEKHILAFGRRFKNCWTITIVPLQLASLCREQRRPITKLNWKDTEVVLMDAMPDTCENVFTKEKHSGRSALMIKDAFAKFPFAVLTLERTERERSAGILLALSSLPSSFGVGDLGPQASNFVEFLSRTRQSYWQLLPLNTTNASNGNSPYSTFSSMAGNTLFISPELLVSDSLLAEDDLDEFRNVSDRDSVDYEVAEKNKDVLLAKAWYNFNQAPYHHKSDEFEKFITDESYWLDEYAVYMQLKSLHHGAPWYDWMEKYKYRDKESIDSFVNDNSDALRRIKWEQYIFHSQWKRLKKHCESLDIKLFGDLPFYVCHDSVDVWANREMFSIDEQGDIKFMAGVPPDYFNSTGQLWGMPVFDWERLKDVNYDWWIKRIKKNLQFYDLLRFDHFRAFADYWAVPAGEDTAINGTWRQGPGSSFFEVVERELGRLPFVAEDLGDINEDVYRLRDKFKLPGMKVLQFAFSGSIPSSAYSPHNFESANFIVYTGTHDNNTTQGWFRRDISRTDRLALGSYVGHAAKEKSIHLDMIRLAYNSIAKIAVIPMQDILGLSEKHRMNSPGTTTGNWTWRLRGDEFGSDLEKVVRDLVAISNRY